MQRKKINQLINISLKKFLNFKKINLKKYLQSIQLYDIIKSKLRDHKSRKENADERILKLNSTEQQKSQPQHPEKVKRLAS